MVRVGATDTGEGVIVFVVLTCVVTFVVSVITVIQEVDKCYRKRAVAVESVVPDAVSVKISPRDTVPKKGDR